MRIWVVLFFTTGFAGVMAYGATINEIAEKRRGEYEAVYKDIHQNPELSGAETRTAGKFAVRTREEFYRVLDSYTGKLLKGLLAAYFGV